MGLGGTLYAFSGIVVPDDYPSIQEAINQANEGDTIFVRNGTYYENVVVNKTVSLVGESVSNTVIDGNGIGDVVQIVEDNVSLSKFTIRNSGSVDFGIHLYVRNYLEDLFSLWMPDEEKKKGKEFEVDVAIKGAMSHPDISVMSELFSFHLKGRE